MLQYQIEHEVKWHMNSRAFALRRRAGNRIDTGSQWLCHSAAACMQHGWQFVRGKGTLAVPCIGYSTFESDRRRKSGPENRCAVISYHVMDTHTLDCKRMETEGDLG